MSAQHTPGFWATDFGVTRVEVFDEGGRIIATLPRDAEYGRPHAMTAANARLIAAAPEMLAVLLKLRRGDLHQRVRPLYNEAQAIIAKATGSAS